MNKRLNILFLTSSYPTEENPVLGGFVKEHAKAANLNNDVTVMVLCRGVKSQRSLYHTTESMEDGIKTIWFRHKISPIPKTSYPLQILGILDCFRKAVRQGYRPDVLHANFFTAGVPAVILGKIYNIPVVITEHSTAFPRHLLTFVGRIQARFAMNRANAVLPVSGSLKRHIESYGVRNEFITIPNVVNTAMFYYSDCGRKEVRVIKRILMVALLDPKKGVPHLLNAVANLSKKRNDFMLDIIGDGPCRSEYERMVVDMGLKDIIIFHGLKTKVEVSEFMRQSDLFVLPSLVETFSVATAEALASGLPVVVTQCGGPEEFVDDSCGVVVRTGDGAALAEGLAMMLDHLDSYDRLAIARIAKQKFGCETVASALDNVYSSVAG